MKKIIFFISLISLSVFAKDYKISDDTLCSGVESADNFKALMKIGISKEEAYEKIKGCKALKTKSYSIDDNIECSNKESKKAFETLLKVGYDENYALKKVPECKNTNQSYRYHKDDRWRDKEDYNYKDRENYREKSEYKKDTKHYRVGGRKVEFRDDNFNEISGEVLQKCLQVLANGGYYYYTFDRDMGKHNLYKFSTMLPTQQNDCPKYLMEKK